MYTVIVITSDYIYFCLVLVLPTYTGPSRKDVKYLSYVSLQDYTVQNKAIHIPRNM